MADPEYPQPELDRRWRTSYRRRARRLLLVFVLVLAGWAALALLVVRIWF